MSLRTKYSSLIVVIALLLSCNSNTSSTYYEKDIRDWNTYVKALGVKEIQLKNTILLILKGSECSPSVAELQWWNDFFRQNSELNVQLIILERYATSLKAFLEYEEIQIPVLRDSSGILFDHNLLPSTPMKVFIDAKGDVKKISAIGTDIDPNQEAFISSLRL